MKAKLRVCASCEWIFSGGVECPKCLFGSYGAHFVYGSKAYKHALTQEPWMNKKIADYSVRLFREIKETNENIPPKKVGFNFIGRA